MAIRKFIFVLLLLVLPACRDTKFFSSVPSYPVQFDLNIWGEYPHFVTGNGFQTLRFTKKRFEVDYLGYAGLLIWVDMNAEYRAADLCCPHCLKRTVPLEVDGFYAVCPECGEQYDLSFGVTNPTKGISTEMLRRYSTTFANGHLFVSP
ncbi:MAG: hypothetical protein IJS05_03815 [Paludibacteraceae bacterium]|nr:hypothetical protein [Paludibacteraceae bacterium]